MARLRRWLSGLRNLGRIDWSLPVGVLMLVALLAGASLRGVERSAVMPAPTQAAQADLGPGLAMSAIAAQGARRF